VAAMYDAAVIGAGPAGSCLARLLAGRGAAVVLIDKARFPRPKPCAGGISPSAALRCGLSMEGSAEARITSAVLSYESSERLVAAGRRTLAWTVERDRFDALLVDLALAAGAGFYDGLPLGALRRAGNRWEVEAGGRTFRARFIVGADGAASRVARLVGARRPPMAACIEATAAVSGPGPTPGRGRLVFDFGRIEAGYAWAFAKSDGFSVGVYTVRPRSGRALRRDLEAYISGEPLLAGARVSRPRRWFVPRGVCMHRKIHFDGGLLVGDAAGLADPLTGEGIGPALVSAELASRALAHSLDTARPNLARYSRWVDRRLRPGFARARAAAAVAYRGRGEWVGKFVRSGFGERPWAEVARGEVSYLSLVWNLAAFSVLGPFRRPRDERSASEIQNPKPEAGR